jgi:hypothetical protein
VWYFTQTETSRVKIEGGKDLAKNVKVDVMESFGEAKVIKSDKLSYIYENMNSENLLWGSCIF